MIGGSAQAFALIGTLIGVLVTIIGIGPQTLPDMAYHGLMLLLLVIGMVAISRSASVAGDARCRPAARGGSAVRKVELKMSVSVDGFDGVRRALGREPRDFCEDGGSCGS